MRLAAVLKVSVCRSWPDGLGPRLVVWHAGTYVLMNNGKHLLHLRHNKAIYCFARADRQNSTIALATAHCA